MRVERVVAFGQVPIWEQLLPNQLWRFYQAHQFVPRRMEPTSNEHLLTYDRAIAGRLAASAVFVAPTDLSCNREGCLTFPTERNEAVAWDYGHFTASGSEAVLGAARSAILGHCCGKEPDEPEMVDRGVLRY